MSRPTSLLLAWLSLGALLLAITGCSQNEHKKTTITQEEKEGPVEDTSPGEMIVE